MPLLDAILVPQAGGCVLLDTGIFHTRCEYGNSMPFSQCSPRSASQVGCGVRGLAARHDWHLRQQDEGKQSLLVCSMLNFAGFCSDAVLFLLLQSIITGLRQLDDEGQQLASLTELCELLSISTEDALAAFPVESVVPLLVSN